MAIFFDAASGGFYDDAVAPPPGGAVPIGEEAHAELLAGQAEGREIVAGDDGLPVLRDPPPPPAPPPIRIIRSLAFRQRVPDAKRVAISVAAMQAAAAGDGQLLTFMLDQAASVTTDLDLPAVQAGVAALLAAKLVTQAEADAMLANGTPEERG